MEVGPAASGCAKPRLALDCMGQLSSWEERLARVLRQQLVCVFPARFAFVCTVPGFGLLATRLCIGMREQAVGCTSSRVAQLQGAEIPTVGPVVPMKGYSGLGKSSKGKNGSGKFKACASGVSRARPPPLPDPGYLQPVAGPGALALTLPFPLRVVDLPEGFMARWKETAARDWMLGFAIRGARTSEWQQRPEAWRQTLSLAVLDGIDEELSAVKDRAWELLLLILQDLHCHGLELPPLNTDLAATHSEPVQPGTRMERHSHGVTIVQETSLVVPGRQQQPPEPQPAAAPATVPRLPPVTVPVRSAATTRYRLQSSAPMWFTRRGAALYQRARSREPRQQAPPALLGLGLQTPPETEMEAAHSEWQDIVQANELSDDCEWLEYTPAGDILHAELVPTRTQGLACPPKRLEELWRHERLKRGFQFCTMPSGWHRGSGMTGEWPGVISPGSGKGSKGVLGLWETLKEAAIKAARTCGHRLMAPCLNLEQAPQLSEHVNRQPAPCLRTCVCARLRVSSLLVCAWCVCVCITEGARM